MTARDMRVQKGGSTDADPNVENQSWVFEGILTGVVGAATVAVLFLVFDTAGGRPFWTPFALGAGLFRGEIPPAGTPVEPVLIAAYTVLHGGVFVSVGLLAAWELMTGSRFAAAGSVNRVLALACLFFVAVSALFAVFVLLGVPGIMQLFGIGRIMLANLIASSAMAVTLIYLAERSRIGRSTAT